MRRRHRLPLSLPALLIAAVAVLCAAPRVAVAQQSSKSIINSPHNLSASGPGAIRASSEQEVCIFCHTPHNAAPIQPLWNRNVPVNAYTIYSSSSLDAAPGQPTGSSKLCLSCHDGTIAIGSVLSRDQTIAMAGGMTTIPPGHAANLGTDLSDDHPISFRYDEALAGRDPKLVSPSQLPQQIRLDARQEMQCTSCHEPHDNSRGRFLVMDNSQSQLCASCHKPGHTDVAGHVDCASCHRPHTAPSGAFLLKGQTVAETCAACHAGQSGANQGANVMSDLTKVSRHESSGLLTSFVVGGAGAGSGERVPGQVSCNDCHESHTMMTGTAVAPAVSPKLGRIDGVNATGAAVARAQFQYEVCFKCHSGTSAGDPAVTRQVTQTDTRLEFSPSAVSYHPVQAAGKNSDVPSLVPPLTTASLIYCTDCHASDTAAVAGPGTAGGPHGSNVSPLLRASYETLDGTSESANAYALCYSCHERASILGNESFSLHSRHVVDSRTPCSVCHDSHGIPAGQGTVARNSKLINFDIAVVRPDNVTGRLEYRMLGGRAGECYLSCHGVDHSPKAYPFVAPPVVDPVPPPATPVPVPSPTPSPSPSPTPAPAPAPAPAPEPVPAP